MQTKKLLLIVSLGIIVVIVVVFGFFRIYKQQPVDYLIAGVPYFSMYDGTPLWSGMQTSAAIILGYWGDNSLSFNEIVNDLSLTFSRPGISTSTLPELGDMKLFFEKQGYEAKLVSSRKVEDLYPYIKNNIPIIVVRRLSFAPDLPSLYDVSVVIGLLSSKKEVVLHENILGNNYYLPFSEFSKSAISNFLVVEPSLMLKKTLSQPDRTKPYASRLKLMDDPDIFDINLKWLAAANFARSNDDVSLQLLQWEKAKNHPAFLKLHPAAKIFALSEVAYRYSYLGKYDTAISMIEKDILPINRNLNEPFGEWNRSATFPQRVVYPYVILAKAYFGKGDKNKAKKIISDELASAINNEEQIKTLKQALNSFSGSL